MEGGRRQQRIRGGNAPVLGGAKRALPNLEMLQECPLLFQGGMWRVCITSITVTLHEYINFFCVVSSQRSIFDYSQPTAAQANSRSKILPATQDAMDIEGSWKA